MPKFVVARKNVSLTHFVVEAADEIAARALVTAGHVGETDNGPYLSYDKSGCGPGVWGQETITGCTATTIQPVNPETRVATDESWLTATLDQAWRRVQGLPAVQMPEPDLEHDEAFAERMKHAQQAA